jgi:uncharacterized BrkB/YihY/UPF0761 family membrane protein
VFSLAPLLLIVISIAGLVFGQDAVRGEVFIQLQGLLGTDASKAIEGLVASVSKPAEGSASTAIGVALLLVGATSVFGELQDALDRIWRAPARDRSGGRFLIGTYIGRKDLASGFGAAGSLIVVFVWVYFTWVYAKTFGSMRAVRSEFDAKSGVSARNLPP